MQKLKQNKRPAKAKAAHQKKNPSFEVFWGTGVIAAILCGASFWYDSSLRDPYLSIRFIWLAAFLLITIVGFLIFKGRKLQFQHPLTLSFVGANIMLTLWGIICINQAINIQESIYVISRQFLFFITFLVLFILLKQNVINLNKLSQIITIILLIQSIVGTLQAYDIAFTNIPGNPHPTGFAGNRNLYASFLPLLLPFGFYTLFISKRNWQIIAAISITLGLIALILGQTRSAWLAFLMSVVVFQLLFFIYRQEMPKALVLNWGRLSSIGLVAIVAAIGLIFMSDHEGNLRERLKNRLVSIYDFSELDPTNEAARNVNERLLVWQGTLQMIQDKPLFGVAPGNWRLNFPLYGSMSAIKNNEPEQLDKIRVQPHNVYLQIASETGLPGLILFLMTGVIILIAAYQVINKTTDYKIRLLTFFLLAGITAFASDMVFSFPQERVEHSVMVMLIIAILFSHLEQEMNAAKVLLEVPVLGYANIMIPFLIFSIVLGNAKRKFDYYTMEAIKYETLNAAAKALEVSEAGKSKLVTLDPVSDPMELHTARAYLNLKQFDKALDEILIAERYHPNSHRIHNTRAVIFLKQNKYKEAIEPLQKALKYSPDYPPALQNLAYSYYRTNQYKVSLDVLQRIDIQNDTLLQKLEKDLKRRLANEAPNADPNH